MIRQRPESEATGLCRIKSALRGSGGIIPPGRVKGGSPCRRRHLPAQRGSVPNNGDDGPPAKLRSDGQNAGTELCTLAEALEAKAGLHAHVGELFRDRKALSVIADDEPEGVAVHAEGNGGAGRPAVLDDVAEGFLNDAEDHDGQIRRQFLLVERNGKLNRHVRENALILFAEIRDGGLKPKLKLRRTKLVLDAAEMGRQFLDQ